MLSRLRVVAIAALVVAAYVYGATALLHTDERVARLEAALLDQGNASTTTVEALAARLDKIEGPATLTQARLELLHSWLRTIAHRKGDELPKHNGTWDQPTR